MVTGSDLVAREVLRDFVGGERLLLRLNVIVASLWVTDALTTAVRGLRLVVSVELLAAVGEWESKLIVCGFVMVGVMDGMIVSV